MTYPRIACQYPFRVRTVEGRETKRHTLGVLSFRLASLRF
jgi:hypothetical protein